MAKKRDPDPDGDYFRDPDKYPQGSPQYVRSYVFLDAFEDARMLASGLKGYDNEEITQDQLSAAFRCRVVTVDEVVAMYRRGLEAALEGVKLLRPDDYENEAGDPVVHPAADLGEESEEWDDDEEEWDDDGDDDVEFGDGPTA